ncbi:uncharacterized protein [Diadema antillarum]|uniref:uncharacterized protein n=1 Tax=Diadema antillarum TaxID=105358 RepID=UPI003A8538DC
MASQTGIKRPRPRSSTKGGASPIYSTPESPTLLPSIQRLLETQLQAQTEQIQENIKGLEMKIAAEVRQIDKKLVDLTKAVGFNAETLETLQKDVIPKIQHRMEEDKKSIEEELDRVNAYICRENLVFIGVPEAENENVESVLAKLLSEKLQIPREEVEQIEYQRVHRLPAAARPRPIKARFLKYKQREMVLRNAKHLKGTPIYITEDLPRRVRRERQSQLPALKTARAAGKLAYFSRAEPWKLYVDRVFLPKEQQVSFVERWGKGERRIQLRTEPARKNRPDTSAMRQQQPQQMDATATTNERMEVGISREEGGQV